MNDGENVRDRPMGSESLGRVPMWRDVIRLWRVLVGAVVIQLLGGLIGLLVHPFHDAWDNNSIGGALATPVGFLVGLWWQLSSPERRGKTPILPVVFLGLLAFGLGAFTLFGTLPRLDEEAERLNALASLPEDSLNGVIFYDRYGREKLLGITEKEALRGFVLACRDTKGYSPNHPRYERSWYAVIDGPETIELECHYEERWPDRVVGYFVAKHGNSTRYYGSFISADLRPWFEKYVECAASDQEAN